MHVATCNSESYSTCNANRHSQGLYGSNKLRGFRMLQEPCVTDGAACDSPCHKTLAPGCARWVAWRSCWWCLRIYTWFSLRPSERGAKMLRDSRCVLDTRFRDAGWRCRSSRQAREACEQVVFSRLDTYVNAGKLTRLKQYYFSLLHYPSIFPLSLLIP